MSHTVHLFHITYRLVKPWQLSVYLMQTCPLLTIKWGNPTYCGKNVSNVSTFVFVSRTMAHHVELGSKIPLSIWPLPSGRGGTGPLLASWSNIWILNQMQAVTGNKNRKCPGPCYPSSKISIIRPNCIIHFTFSLKICISCDLMHLPPQNFSLLTSSTPPSLSTYPSISGGLNIA